MKMKNTNSLSFLEIFDFLFNADIASNISSNITFEMLDEMLDVFARRPLKRDIKRLSLHFWAEMNVPA